MDAIEATVDRIEQACQESQAKEIPSSFIGERVMAELHNLDKVAYVRFASVYRQFRDATEFLEELKGILNLKEDKGENRTRAEKTAEEKDSRRNSG